MEFQTKNVIELDSFIKTADANIGFALNPENDIVQGMEGVQEIVNKLDEVKSGALEIQPPLSEEQINSYREKTTTILGIGQRAVAALESADKEKGSRLGRLFRGKGSSPKL
jgi:hypothetical protein